MDAGLVAALLLAVAFAASNGLHDASNAIATLVATRAATPRQAIVLATVFNLLGPFVIGAAVADTIGGIVEVSPSEAVHVIGAGLTAAVLWNLATWLRGLPSSSAHALIGGLVGAGAVVSNGVEVPARAMALGIPAKMRLDSVPDGTFDPAVALYAWNGQRYKDELKRLD